MSSKKDPNAEAARLGEILKQQSSDAAGAGFDTSRFNDPNEAASQLAEHFSASNPAFSASGQENEQVSSTPVSKTDAPKGTSSSQDQKEGSSPALTKPQLPKQHPKQQPSKQQAQQTPELPKQPQTPQQPKQPQTPQQPKQPQTPQTPPSKTNAPKGTTSPKEQTKGSTPALTKPQLPKQQAPNQPAPKQPTPQPPKELTPQAPKSQATPQQPPKQQVKQQPAKQEPVKQQPAKQEPVKQQPAKQEPVKQQLAKQEPVKQQLAKQEPVKQQPAKQEPVKQQLAKQEPVKQQPAKQEPAKQETVKQQSPKQEPPKQQPTKQEPPKQQPSKQEPAKQEPVKQQSKQQPVKPEPARKESAKQEPKQQPAKQDEHKQQILKGEYDWSPPEGDYSNDSYPAPAGIDTGGGSSEQDAIDAYDPSGSGGGSVPGESYSDQPAADWGNFDYDYPVYHYDGKPPPEGRPENADDDADDDDDAAEVYIKGAKFGFVTPKKEDARLQDVVVARSVNRKRDDKTGVWLSTYNLNYLFSSPDDRDKKFTWLYGEPDKKFLPTSTDLRPVWGSMLDQFDLGSCVSNSISYCLRYCYKKQKLGDFTPSRLFVYYNGRLLGGYPLNQDTGLTIRDGYKSVAKYSACSEKNWPYVPAKFSQRPPDACYTAAKQHPTFQYISLNNDDDGAQIKKCLKDGFPVSFGTALFSSFMTAAVAKTGNVPMPNAAKEQRCGGHAMTIVGHDDVRKVYIVANSWGGAWGARGFCFIPQAYIHNDDYTGDLWSPRLFQ